MKADKTIWIKVLNQVVHIHMMQLYFLEQIKKKISSSQLKKYEKLTKI